MEPLAVRLGMWLWSHRAADQKCGYSTTFELPGCGWFRLLHVVTPGSPPENVP